MNDRLKKIIGRYLSFLLGSYTNSRLRDIVIWQSVEAFISKSLKTDYLKNCEKLWEDCHSKLLCVFVCCWHLCQTKRRKSSPTSLSFCQCTDYSICQNLSYTEFTVVTSPPWWTTLWFYRVFRILRQIWNKWIFKGKVYKPVLTHFRCDKK